MAVLAWVSTGIVSRSEVTEYQLKAEFIINFAKYIRWPEALFDSPSSPVVITVLGSNPFGNALENAAVGRSVEGHAIHVVRAASISKVEPSHVVYVSPSEKTRYSELLAELCRRPVVTIGEDADFSRVGGMITFIPKGDKIGFAINLKCVRDDGPQIGAQLLKLAQSIETD